MNSFVKFWERCELIKIIRGISRQTYIL